MRNKYLRNSYLSLKTEKKEENGLNPCLGMNWQYESVIKAKNKNTNKHTYTKVEHSRGALKSKQEQKQRSFGSNQTVIVIIYNSFGWR